MQYLAKRAMLEVSYYLALNYITEHSTGTKTDMKINVTE
jgi:hypothetical protein